MLVRVDWLSAAEGGRKAIPLIDSYYAPTARFSDGLMWSCCLRDRKKINDYQETADIKFFFFRDVKLPNSFELTEGPKVVARVALVDEV